MHRKVHRLAEIIQLEKFLKDWVKNHFLKIYCFVGLQEPFYVRSNSSYPNSLHSPCRDPSTAKEIDSLSGTDNESKSSMHGWSILAPILLCLCIMFVYMCLGKLIAYNLHLAYIFLLF